MGEMRVEVKTGVEQEASAPQTRKKKKKKKREGTDEEFGMCSWDVQKHPVTPNRP